MDMRELDRQALCAIARPADLKQRVYWTILSPEEGGILFDESGQLAPFACPEPGETTDTTVIGQRLEEIRPDPRYRRLYAGDLDALSDVTKANTGQDILVCIAWQSETMPARAYAYYHRACFSQRPAKLPNMKKHYLLQHQLSSPFVPCSHCGLNVKSSSRRPAEGSQQKEE